MSRLHVINLACYQVAGRTPCPGAAWLPSPQRFITAGHVELWESSFSNEVTEELGNKKATHLHGPAVGAVKVAALLSAKVKASMQPGAGL